MTVDLEVTFSKEEVHEMCLNRCRSIELPVGGKFEARGGLYGSGEVICAFVLCQCQYGRRDQATQPEVPTQPATESSSATAMPLD